MKITFDGLDMMISSLMLFSCFGVLANVLAVGSSVCFLDLLWTDVDLLHNI